LPAWVENVCEIVPVSANHNPERLRSTTCCYFHAEHFPARGDEKEMAVFAAEDHVAGPGFGDGNVRELPARLVEDRDTFAGEIDVAPGVNGHAVGAQLAEKGLVLQDAVGLDGIRIRFPRADIGDVERLSVGRADDAVRLFEVRGHGRRLF
jgi:hypothetical protein